MCASDARAPRCAGGTRPMYHGRALYKRETALLRCKAVLPRASPGPHLVRSLARVARLRATAGALSGRSPSTCHSDARARLAALVALGPCPMERRCTSEKPPSFGTRLCSHVPALALTW